ncbi:M14 family metallopeptidase [Flavobacterium sp. ASW18X]|uniref:M14 family metallopeptidase n=1 Tax=Flavobacterium sp. ASW18X TaxID=2572595 RepID=UPI0010ADF876|nr:M14 family metallopeptidase [Flavobacterium sp. ASW18X]TKD59051.1 hypothetical protein FBT53_14155 [Flavobacterium sp. ASW18X]
MKLVWRSLSLIVFLILIACDEQTEKNEQTFKTTFENSGGTETATYQEVIDFYLNLAKEYPEIHVQNIGATDSGKPLHLVTYNPDGNFNFKKLQEDKTILLINNGIHPGESDGIDASMMLFRDLANNKIPTPKNTILTTIPVYNVGGMLNRNSTSRANQNGPKAYGFRGNARNFDLNRDFIKMDTKNAATFATIFHMVKPDVFVDNHVSNGADYQYTLTHLFTQHNKLGGAAGDFLHSTLMPQLEQKLAAHKWDITPYVNVFNKPPETGFSQFLDNPRYSTGYTTLWNTLGLMVETHMLKPYKQRVEGTYELMKQLVVLTEEHHKKIKNLRKEAQQTALTLEKYPLRWELDSTQVTTLNFKGYKADTIASAITGFNRLKYNRDSTFTKQVPYYNYYKGTEEVEVPEAYLIKKSWSTVLERLSQNGISYQTIAKDSVLEVEAYKIASYETYSNAYEGHYPHYDTRVTKSSKSIALEKGDVLVKTNQLGVRYVLEVLEPTAVDSFFNWNFFDTILQQKEGFSPYVFEDTALEILENNSILKDSLMAKKQRESSFANNWYAQLDYIFKHSQLYERAHLSYPIYRVTKGKYNLEGLIQ